VTREGWRFSAPGGSLFQSAEFLALVYDIFPREKLGNPLNPDKLCQPGKLGKLYKLYLEKPGHGL